jgi:tRNA-intron endonuclease, archaea type
LYSDKSLVVFLFEWLYRSRAVEEFLRPLEAKAVEQPGPAPVEPMEAHLSKGVVHLRDPEKLMDLREKAFGTLTGDRIILNPYETFYLVEKRRINVFDEKTKQARSLQELVTKLSVGKPSIWTKYLVYRDLRDRGYLVREGEAGYDFESFGKGAMRRLVSIVFEGGESTLEKLARLSAKANKDGKDLVLAVIDRRTDIVYYTLNPEDFKGQ